MLVVIKELEAWMYLLEGAKFKFEVCSDYKYLKSLKHVLEVRIEKTDGLSRRLDLTVRVENNNENQKLIKEEW